MKVEKGMAEEESETTKEEHMESKIQTAMRSRLSHFKQRSDSLTLEGVRRLLEKDLGLQEFALDVHKRFIKQCLVKCLEGAGDNDALKMSGEVEENGAITQDTEGPKEECQSEDVKDLCPDNDDTMEDSPVLGLIKEQKGFKLETKEAKGNGKKVVTSETLIKKAVRKRSSYIKANAEKVTMAGLRRLLEEDLQLDKFTLDPYKKFIIQQLDEVLASSEVSEPANNAKKIVKKKPDLKVTKKVSSEENFDSSDKESDEEEKQEDEVKPRKKSVPKGKMQTSVRPKKRKGEEANQPSRKRVKATKAALGDSDGEDIAENSEDDQSHSSPEKPAKKKEVSTSEYGKHVENLKSVIKACGMSVPPSIYKKVKQVSENKREGQLIKELEEILSKEGLSSNPSEKEIKEVRRTKARAKELEGIDLSNIVSSSRRRSTTSFATPPPPKPKVPVETNGSGVKDNGNDKKDKGSDNEEDEEDEDKDSSDDEGSQSEEFNGDEDDSD